MTRRYLFGPVPADFMHRHLQQARRSGACLAFGYGSDTDLTVRCDDTWQSVGARLPAGWQADAVVVYCCYSSVPAWVWSAPVPLLGWAPDWNLQFHAYRRLLPACAEILTDAPGVAVLDREGIPQGQAVN